MTRSITMLAAGMLACSPVGAFGTEAPVRPGIKVRFHGRVTIPQESGQHVEAMHGAPEIGRTRELHVPDLGIPHESPHSLRGCCPDESHEEFRAAKAFAYSSANDGLNYDGA